MCQGLCINKNTNWIWNNVISTLVGRRWFVFVFVYKIGSSPGHLFGVGLLENQLSVTCWLLIKGAFVILLNQLKIM